MPADQSAWQQLEGLSGQQRAANRWTSAFQVVESIIRARAVTAASSSWTGSDSPIRTVPMISTTGRLAA